MLLGVWSRCWHAKCITGLRLSEMVIPCSLSSNLWGQAIWTCMDSLTSRVVLLTAVSSTPISFHSGWWNGVEAYYNYGWLLSLAQSDCKLVLLQMVFQCSLCLCYVYLSTSTEDQIYYTRFVLNGISILHPQLFPAEWRWIWNGPSVRVLVHSPQNLAWASQVREVGSTGCSSEQRYSALNKETKHIQMADPSRRQGPGNLTAGRPVPHNAY